MMAHFQASATPLLEPVKSVQNTRSLNTKRQYYTSAYGEALEQDILELLPALRSTTATLLATCHCTKDGGLALHTTAWWL
ncbi:hypothetical protein NDU88_003699 [Pleurodeles waltl]|uniref:Uncharacterized protein n=1 Tax=Pleurodeles waltl TaxID=8319 RepID=A0AAV7SGP7_PLEWA|nr:hypothetical protein NDU88_003699 [Pleurodeles waltl]